MREILFKAKRLGNNEWIEGYYFQRPNDLTREKHYIVTVGKCQWYEINSDTLCQFTGEYDKEGNMIWEHDIVINEKETGIIIYETNYHAFVCLHLENIDLFSFISSLVPCAKQIGNDVGCKVIGNKFDNPELLEKQ